MPVDPVTLMEKELAKIAITGTTSIIDRARKWYRSYALLILGQERAGKTALYKFLRSRLLSKDGEPTPPTVEDVNSGIFQFEWTTTDSGTLVIEFRNVGDRSGQIGPHAHAKMLVDKKPHLLMIVLDITARDKDETGKLHASYETWFEYFCTYIGDRLMNRPGLARRVSSRLRNMVILLNKADTLEPKETDAIIREAKTQIRGILRGRLQAYFGGRVHHYPILECSIVSNPKHGALGDTVSKLQEVIRQLVTSTITH